MMDELGAAPTDGGEALHPAGRRAGIGTSEVAADAGELLANAAVEVIPAVVSGALRTIPSILGAAAEAIPSLAGAIVEGIADGLSK